MNNYLQIQKAFAWLGVLLLPGILFLLFLIADCFAPAALKFPQPQKILSEMLKSFTEGNVWSALANTFFTLLVALSFSILFGVITGLFLGLNKYIWNLSQPTVDFFRSIPVTFLIPGAAILFGVSSPHIIWILAVYPCFLIIVFSVRAGINTQELERIHSYYIISGSTSLIRRFFKVTLYEILPNIFSGFRIALSYCLVVITVLEYMKLGNKTGIGGLINDELNNTNYVRVYALTFIIGILGYVLNKSVEIIQNKKIHWQTNNK